jgi:hypothetical protein
VYFSDHSILLFSRTFILAGKAPYSGRFSINGPCKQRKLSVDKNILRAILIWLTSGINFCRYGCARRVSCSTSWRPFACGARLLD